MVFSKCSPNSRMPGEDHNESKTMTRTLMSASFGLALAVSAFALGATPASAIETQAAISSAVTSNVTLSDWGPRCRRWRRYCEERHPMRRWKFRGCLALHGCR